MKIGIDISQLAYSQTGVANYLGSLILELVRIDRENQYVFFYSSLRRKLPSEYASLPAQYGNVTVKSYKLPPSVLDIMWNIVHKIPIEKFIGNVDIFISSDWTEPPSRSAKKATILYDMIVYKYPEETAKKIIDVQKRKLKWVKKETEIVFCISKSSARDAKDLLGIDGSRLKVLYPGITNI